MTIMMTIMKMMFTCEVRANSRPWWLCQSPLLSTPPIQAHLPLTWTDALIGDWSMIISDYIASDACDDHDDSDQLLEISDHILSDINDDHDDSDQWLIISDHMQVRLVMIMMIFFNDW